jgi:transcriptional regulator with XRE-family HTH domain
MNKKAELLSYLKKKNIINKRGNKIYLKIDSFEVFKIRKISLKNEDNVLILTKGNIIFEYWIKQKLLIPPWETHWFQLKDSFILKLKDNLLEKVLHKAIDKAGNLNKLCRLLGMSYPSFYELFHGKINMISIRKLKKILDYLDIPFVEFNNKIEYTKKGFKISIKNPIFPINLNSVYGAHILGAIMSDGCIYIDKKARNVARTKYSTNEKESIIHFISLINKIYGQVHVQKEHVRNCDIIRIGSSIVGETLLKVGAALGHKAKNDAEIPWMIRLGPRELKISYVKSVFDDEASIYDGKKTHSGYIILSRYKHLSNLTAIQKRMIMKLDNKMSERKFPTGHINKSISIKRALELSNNNKDLECVLKSTPRLLYGESEILDDINISHRIWYRSLNKTHLGNYSLCCDLFISRKEDILRFYKEVGFNLKTKQEKLRKLIMNMEVRNGIKTI